MSPLQGVSSAWAPAVVGRVWVRRRNRCGTLHNRGRLAQRPPGGGCGSGRWPGQGVEQHLHAAAQALAHGGVFDPQPVVTPHLQAAVAVQVGHGQPQLQLLAIWITDEAGGQRAVGGRCTAQDLDRAMVGWAGSRLIHRGCGTVCRPPASSPLPRGFEGCGQRACRAARWPSAPRGGWCQAARRRVAARPARLKPSRARVAGSGTVGPPVGLSLKRTLIE